jgi:hypothetical protein
MVKKCRAWRCTVSYCQRTCMDKKPTSSEEQLPSQCDLRTIRVAPQSDMAGRPANVSEEGKAPMGEVRVKVKLTNAGDEVLVRRGLLTADKIRSYEAEALVNTGAVRSVLPAHVVQLLGCLLYVRRGQPTPMMPQRTSTFRKWSALASSAAAPLKRC